MNRVNGIFKQYCVQSLQVWPSWQRILGNTTTHARCTKQSRCPSWQCRGLRSTNHSGWQSDTWWESKGKQQKKFQAFVISLRVKNFASLVWQMPKFACVDSMCINNSGLIRAELQLFFASSKQKCCLFFPCFLTSLALGVFPANLFLPELFSTNDSRAYTILWESNTVVVFCCSRVAPLKFSSYTTWYFAWHNLNTTISLPIHLWTSIYK